jgi:hypothetical protein
MVPHVAHQQASRPGGGKIGKHQSLHSGKPTRYISKVLSLLDPLSDASSHRFIPEFSSDCFLLVI